MTTTTSNSDTTNAIHALRGELAARLDTTLEIIAHSGAWHLYKGSPPGSLSLLHGPCAKKELLAWMNGLTYGLAHQDLLPKAITSAH